MKIESISCQVRTARKQHVCELCLCPIHKGEEYGYEVLKVDGKIEAHKRHLECDELTAKDEFQTEDYACAILPRPSIGRCVTISICIIMGMIAGLALCLAE